MTPGERLVLDIESIAAGGEGVGRDGEGRVVFVERTAPGDRVAATIRESRKRFSRARPVAMLRPGPSRREAPCALYERCGGCRLQHMDLEGQRAAKRAIVGDALARIGRVECEIDPVVHAGPPFGYRNRVTFGLRRTQTGSVVAGTRRIEDPARVLDAADCPLAEAAIRKAWGALRGEWGEGAAALPAGRELRITLRATRRGEVTLYVRGRGPGAGDPARIAKALDGLAAFHWRSGARRRLLSGAETFEEVWRGISFRLGPETFLQPNREIAVALDGHLDRLLGDPAGLRVLDLYGGVGARAIHWALRGAAVSVCEVDSEAVESGRAAAEAVGVAVDYVTGRVEDRITDLLPADVIVVNPPRAGLARGVATELGIARARAIAYVSCDPATLARDLRRIGSRWSIQSVTPFDAFPQTAHVETIAWLEPA